MLEEKDLQAIGDLIVNALTKNKKEILEVFEERNAELLEVINDGFSAVQEQSDEHTETLKKHSEMLKKHSEKPNVQEVEMAKRPTRDEIFRWGDTQIVDLQISKNKFEYLHADEIDKLPPQRN